ncbi:MAG: class I SAM-dependent methyltransferase [Burkholderiales bacterium]|jgi:ubiquinone/menaquinone biosynthesis C-methylase UbiE|nr:methyltransferase domain-containing protein [Pseudomonadota bacterium]MDA1011767.1 methyltransferase domain-containing protein [Pseudomonadota bacterium]|tara:strand:- start:3354 stop:4199 length:846 start_codon:yes stop_codon:yes gene_type:complete
MMAAQTLDALVNEHYGTKGLLDRILTAARDAGIVLHDARSDDFSPVSEFHIGGRRATIDLAKMAQLCAGDKVLDIGSGLGGPARTLVEQFDVRVEGIDLTHEFCVVANELTRMTGLSNQAKFFQGDALSLPRDPNTYDVVWTQQSCMNIEDKRQMLSEVCRVLKPGGTYVFQEVLAGNQDSPLKLPVPWAGKVDMSFLWSPDAIRNSILRMGLVEAIWKNATNQYMEEYRILAARTGDSVQPPIMGVHLMLGKQAGIMRKNVVENLSQGLISIYQGVFKKL